MHAACAENGHSSPAGNNGEVQLTVREMLDVPSDSRPVDLPAQDRDAFAEAGVLEKRRSMQPGDRAPPQPLVRTLEEVAEKLGEWHAHATAALSVSLCRTIYIRGSRLLPFLMRDGCREWQPGSVRGQHGGSSWAGSTSLHMHASHLQGAGGRAPLGYIPEIWVGA